MTGAPAQAHESPALLPRHLDPVPVVLQLDAWFGTRAKSPKLVIATGFIAKNPQGQATTLKRNGSDFSATIMGALFRAGYITIWTDVDGVFSADPRKVGGWGPALGR